MNIFQQIDKRYLSQGLFFMATSQALGLLIAAASAYFFANFVNKDVYGTYQFVLTMFGVMSIFILRGVGKQIVRSYVKDGEMTLIPKTIQFIKFAIPVTSIGFISGLYFLYHGNVILTLSLFVITVAFPIISGLQLYDAVLLAKQQFGKQTILNSIQAAIPAISLIAAILVNANLLTLVTTYAISQSLTLLLIYLYIATQEDAFHAPRRIKRTSTEFHLSLGESILEIGKMADRLIVFSFLGPINFAIYTIALLPIRELNRLPSTVRSLVLPKFSQYDFKSVKAKALEKTWIFFFVLFSISIIYALAAPFIFRLVFPLYEESVMYTQVLVFFLPFSSSVILSQALTVFDKTKELYTLNLIYSITAIGLTFLLTAFFGVWGAVAAKNISLLIRFASLYYVFAGKD